MHCFENSRESAAREDDESNHDCSALQNNVGDHAQYLFLVLNEKMKNTSAFCGITGVCHRL